MPTSFSPVAGFPLERLLPPRVAFEPLCLQAQKDRGYLGLVFEALMHGSLGLLVDRRFVPANDGGYQRLRSDQTPPMAIRHQENGIPEFSWAVYSSVDYWFEIDGPMGKWAGNCVFLTGDMALNVLMQPRDVMRPVVVDPSWPHSVTLPFGELCAFWHAWHGSPTWTELRFDRVELSFPSETMLRRLRSFLPQFSVTEACVRRGWTSGRERREVRTLAVRGADDETLLRLFKALPLLNWGLSEEETIGEVRLTSQTQALVPRVYP